MKPVSKKSPSKHKKLSIAFVIDDSLDVPNGVQQTTLSLGEYLKRQGHRVSYLTSVSKRSDVTGIHSFAKVINVKFNGNYVGTPWRTDKGKLKRFLKENTFDIVHVQTPYSPFLAGQIIRLLPQKTKVVANFQIMPRNVFASLGIWLLRFMLFRSFKKIDLFIANTPVVSKYFQKVWLLPRLPIIPTAVDLRDYPATKRPYHIEGKINLLFLGRLVERKGCLDILEAIDLLPVKLQSKLHLHIGGRGVLETKAKQKAAESKLAEQISFHGFIEEEDKSVFLASGDLLVFPSRGGESFGISLLEALASRFGVVLAAHNFGYDTILGDSPKSMFEPKSPQALADCLKYWLEAGESEYEKVLKWQKENLLKYDLEKVIGQKLTQTYWRLLLA